MGVPLNIATGSYQSDVLPFSAQRCINWVPIIPQPQGDPLTPQALFDASGLTQSTASAGGVDRGARTVKGVPYFVTGNTLYSFDSAGVRTSRGTIEGAGRVSMADNGQFLVIVVPGGKSYSFDNVANVLTEITDVDFRVSSTVVFKDGFFVFSAFDGSVFFNSALNNPLAYDGLDFGTAEINPDKITALHVNHNELYVIGEETIEVFQNIGGAGFPFQRIGGANIQKGSFSRFSPMEFDNTFVFLGGGLNEKTAVWRVSGSSSAVKISTSAIDHQIQKFTQDEIANAFSMVWAEHGNYFIAFTFTSSAIPSKTFVFDATTSALAGQAVWHERQTGVVDDRWRVNSIIQAFGKLLVGDSKDGRIGVLDPEALDEYGNPIFRRKDSQPFFNQGDSMFWADIELLMESGVGLTSGQGSDPQVRMSFSDNGARTFSSEFSRSYGKIGEYTRRTVWRRQGQVVRDRVLRFITTEPVRSNILGLVGNLEGGT